MLLLPMKSFHTGRGVLAVVCILKSSGALGSQTKSDDLSNNKKTKTFTRRERKAATLEP